MLILHVLLAGARRYRCIYRGKLIKRCRVAGEVRFKEPLYELPSGVDVGGGRIDKFKGGRLFEPERRNSNLVAGRP